MDLVIPIGTVMVSSGDCLGSFVKQSDGYTRFTSFIVISSSRVSPLGYIPQIGHRGAERFLIDIILTVDPNNIQRTINGAISLNHLPSPLLKLTDFGLSRFITPSSPMLTTRCGSDGWAAPEIIMSVPYDGRDTDSWSCGVALYTLLCGKLPFDDPNDDRRKMALKVAKAQYTYPEGAGSESLRRTIDCLLVRDPKKRTRVGDIWDQEWMNGPGMVERPTRGSKEERLEGGRKRVMDGFLVDGEAIDQVALAELT